MSSKGDFLLKVALFLLLVNCGPTPSSFAQNIGLFEGEIYHSSGDTIQLPHTFLVPYSESLLSPDGGELGPQSYQIFYHTGQVLFAPELPSGNYFIQVKYFLHPPSTSIRLIEPPPDSQDESSLPIFDIPLDTVEESFWNSSKLRKQGSLTRGITTGNNRGLSLTSGLQLQLEGDLGNGLRLEGAISDENIPVQPEGTTQQLADFDRIFIRLSKDREAITLGDYEVSFQQSRFAKLYRNVQGLRFTHQGDKHQASFSGAVAKGQFHTNSFLGREGVSGPYRLSGKNNERFFFILAGSERVYLNGKRLKRGAAFDYIINYNTAEIIFTARHVINRASRIVVDFEYNDRNYNRSLITANSQHQLWNDRVSLQFTYARDADNPNAPFDDPEAFRQIKDSLRSIGDEEGAALTSGVFERGFEPGLPRYARKDTTIRGQNFERYVYSIDSSLAIYQIFFTYIGPGEGMYERDNQGINQNVFTWVGPDANGNPRGSYAPVRKWILPQARQVFNAKANIQLSSKLSLETESGMSLHDKNRLSQLDDTDNEGFAHFSRLNWKEVKLGNKLNLHGNASYQRVNARYNNLDRIYQAEYDRVWDIQDLSIREDEEILSTTLGLTFNEQLKAEAEVGRRNTSSGRTARRMVYRLQSQAEKWLLGNYTYTHIENEGSILGSQTLWQRHEGDIYKRLGPKWQAGIKIWSENREEQVGDSLGAQSFRFMDLTPYIRTQGEGEVINLEASMNYRKEERMFQGRLLPQSLAYTYSLTSTFKPSANFLLRQTSSYRSFQVESPEFLSMGFEDSEVFLSNIQWQFASPNRFLRINLGYDVNAEQISRQELRYIEVTPGLGQYEWIDINEDGIQEVNEFQLSTNPLIANYIKVSLPTREQIPASQLGLNSSIQWDFKSLIGEDKPLPLTLIRSLRMFTQVKVNQNKVRGEGLSQFFIQPGSILTDSSLLRGNSFLKQDWILFQNHPTGDIRLTFLDNRSKQYLSTGDEWRSFQYWQVHGRYNLNQSMSLESQWRKGNKVSTAELLEGRDFDIRFVEVKPQFNFQVNRKLRLSSNMELASRKEVGQQVENATSILQYKVGLEGKLNFSQKNTLLSDLSLISIRQSGSPEFLAGYELRQGFEPGFNTRWRLTLNTFLIDNLALNLSYEGRSSEGIKVLHTARVQLRAIF